jgi:hypothetical protein
VKNKFKQNSDFHLTKVLTFVFICKRNISCKLHEEKYSEKIKDLYLYIEREHEPSRVEHICTTILCLRK